MQGAIHASVEIFLSEFKSLTFVWDGRLPVVRSMAMRVMLHILTVHLSSVYQDKSYNVPLALHCPFYEGCDDTLSFLGLTKERRMVRTS